MKSRALFRPEPHATYSDALHRARRAVDALLPLHELSMLAELRRLMREDEEAAYQLAKHFLADAPHHRIPARVKMLLEIAMEQSE